MYHYYFNTLKILGVSILLSKMCINKNLLEILIKKNYWKFLIEKKVLKIFIKFLLLMIRNFKVDCKIDMNTMSLFVHHHYANHETRTQSKTIFI